MKNSRKWIVIIISLAMMLALAGTAFATEENSTKADDSYGIIDADELQKMFDDFVAQYGLNTKNRSFSVGFCYLKTGDMWFYNEGKWYYSASLYKVPVSMLLAEREVAGEITADTVFENIYSTGSLDTLEKKAIVNSNNDAGHALVEWMGGTYNGKCADQLIKLTELPESYFIQDFYDYSYYSVNFYTQVLKTLYNNQQNYPRIIDYMKQAQPGAYLRTYLEGTYEVAQKYGAFEEVKANPTKNNNHAGGIIFTPNPIVVTVMTINVENFNNRIGDAAKMLSDYALKLDAKYDSYMAEKLRAEQEEADRIAREEEERLAREAAEAQAAAQSATSSDETGNPPDSVFMNRTPEPENTQAQSAATNTTATSDKGGFFSVLAGFGLDYTQRIIVVAGVGIFVLGLILLIAALSMRRRRKYEDEYDADEYDDEEEEYEDDEDDYLEPPPVRKKNRRLTKREEEFYDDFQSSERQDNEEAYYDMDDYKPAQPEEDEEFADYESDESYQENYDNEEFLESDDFLGTDSFLDDGELDELREDFDDEELNPYSDDDLTDGKNDRSGYIPRH
jgi:hypothetical protein